jgi:hypothetical protein
LSGNLLNVKEYLACYGKQFVPGSNGKPPKGEVVRRAVTRDICRLMINNPELLYKTNSLIAAHKEKGAPYFNLPADLLPEGGDKLCGLLRQSGIATEGIGGSVNLNSKERIFYLGGGWLEEYVYGVLADCRLPERDLCMNVEIEWQSESRQTTRNELDIAFCFGNRLNIISCKTSSIDRRGGDDPKGKEALYELDSLAENVGGLFARSMLVSAHRLSPVSRQRAMDMGIQVISGHEVLGLKKYLTNDWLA